MVKTPDKNCAKSAAAAITMAWIAVTGPGGQPIEVQTRHIVTVRPPRGVEHFGPGVRCLIHTDDGKYVAVIETCDMVDSLKAARPD